MQKLILITGLFVSFFASAQRQTENIIIITMDGFRWQEVFKGMDSAIADNGKYNQGDSQYIYKNYWSCDANERRKKLLPSLWNTVEENGGLFGNRDLGSKVDNANPYWFSYPGYNEIMTGYPDTAVNSNSFPANPHVTVLEFLNNQSKLKGKVAAFGAWGAFDRILNEERSKIPVVSAFNPAGGNNPNPFENLINSMNNDSYRPFGEEECLDVFTHYSAMEYLKTKKPRVLYIAYGETDEWAHEGRYRSYLDAAHQVDAWLKQIWDFVQKDPQYKNKTTLFVTVDHGRGDANKDEWTSHNNKIADSHEIWFAVMGPDTPVRGEMSTEMQLYQKQFAQTFANLMGYVYKSDHPIAEPILYVFKMRK
ncbi:MAG: alkaline phosphatase family protein [Sphingobacteriales bacterium]|nr:alkaline phosphatase family protein [Sphingobacteriales bacterium]